MAKRTWVVGPAPPGLICAMVAPSRASSSQADSQVNIGMPEKSSFNLSFGRSLKYQNT
jgi:hypothetical protein